MTTELTLTTGPGPDGAVVLTASGEIDMSNAETFAGALTRAVSGAAGARLVVDLTAVQYLDSAGLSALFAQADHIELRTGPLLAPLLEISGLTELTTVHHA
ncbi:anti-anti-sigma factor [Actinoplanes philippinensis]|uniref:Anti-anti-sigma factor n=1 Tax=Actinoplanes philippinensis TaxID=35752 RepID=A0A1I2KSA7_9ACTN|nr:STAS domain-containing protein [Actinoplanes philippinensis]GIE82140.1 anti-anti-sigma factor [Actinoplanes philippinensis]SFF69835.1 anti-anti-sigma factor [Actinoplanes philippinensis]